MMRSPITSAFPDLSDTDRCRLQRCDVIIDCTADDDILYALEEFPWESEKLFCSLSLGMEARRLFCFLARGTTFPREAFEEEMESWFEKGTAEFDEDLVPWEGIGCWHPVFPARIDAISLLVAGVARIIGDADQNESPYCPKLIVLEQREQDGVFVGISRISDSAIA